MQVTSRVSGNSNVGTRKFGLSISSVLWVCLSTLFGLPSLALGASDSMTDPNWQAYARVSGVSGNLNSIGSDTLNNLMTLWAEGFRKQYPNVKIQIEGKGF